MDIHTKMCRTLVIIHIFFITKNKLLPKRLIEKKLFSSFTSLRKRLLITNSGRSISDLTSTYILTFNCIICKNLTKYIIGDSKKGQYISSSILYLDLSMISLIIFLSNLFYIPTALSWIPLNMLNDGKFNITNQFKFKLLWNSLNIFFLFQIKKIHSVIW